jgi:hypothetical protein
MVFTSFFVLLYLLYHMGLSLSTPFSIIFGHHYEQIVLAMNGVGVAVVSHDIKPTCASPDAEQDADSTSDSSDSLHSYYLLLD